MLPLFLHLIFSSYCKLILDQACEDSFDTLRFCEQQAKKDKALLWVVITSSKTCCVKCLGNHDDHEGTSWILAV